MPSERITEDANGRPSSTRDTVSGNSVNPFAGRDRVLLYTRGMDVDPVHGVELALASLRRAGDGAPPAKVMRELFDLMRTTWPTPLRHDTEGHTLSSTPPMNRRPMLPEDMASFSISSGIASWLRNLFASGNKGA